MLIAFAAIAPFAGKHGRAVGFYLDHVLGF